MRFGSVCSGIEAASVAWLPLGWECAWVSEVEEFPSRVLELHYPSTPNHGDMTDLPAKVAVGEVEAPDVLVGGTPCQSFSVAGLRGGLMDSRGQLTLTYVQLLNTIDKERISEGKKPAIAVWENVPAVLSSRDNAFGHFLAALAGEAEALQPTGKRWGHAGYIRGPKRQVAWRVLDAQHFGLAQRRKRVFVVASAGTVCPAEVLFEFQGVQGNLKQGVKYRQAEHTGCAEAKPFDMLGFGQYGEGKLSSALKARDYKDATDLVVDKTGVRRLTPVEYERLMGFPDNYTQISWRDAPPEQCPLGHRYKALGNSMAVPVMQWIGLRIETAR